MRGVVVQMTLEHRARRSGLEAVPPEVVQRLRDELRLEPLGIAVLAILQIRYDALDFLPDKDREPIARVVEDARPEI